MTSKNLEAVGTTETPSTALTRRWKIEARDQNGTSRADDVEAFIQRTALDTIAPGRFSSLLVLNLFGASMAGVMEPSCVIREIKALEIGINTGFKPGSTLNHLPLKGLWHKHYQVVSLPSLAKNIKRGLDIHGMPLFEQRMKEAQAAGIVRYVQVEDVAALASDVVHGNYVRLHDENRLAGEWLIYAKHEGQNYYLTICTHDKTTHATVRQQIEDVCGMEFPFVRDLLATV
ncbi:TPA: hypothetical protein QDA94_005318 [Burkholderia vietnamiensis]|uniref:Uncharacterized protein n=1 Tax=Burkholderia vietnamiensis TaxID=60552 RepID=A0AAW7T0L7_BURVI|nr:hypothetical protein [Burkholderia vietnamiensis]MDN7795488.1 hypothetical protein [Burkholderia vietnamiensis]HDR8920143.1 hypothetical protein [Burkholderia vietnamiensis]HDR8940676.1 hypothetical protein [Burkholderia vietnamiensis]HDR8977915.1 hypothetical protein [Burkholderia vietnamiensis]HDR9051039.1 hypothetical protein [Burkholderia vietnamiensis]